MKKIKIHGEIGKGLSIIVDDENYDWLNQWKWYAHKKKRTFYAMRHAWVDGKKINIRMHRLIMNAPKGMMVDHMDHDGLNNQKSNLRLCTDRQSNRNRRMQKSNTTGYKGVTFHKPYNKYMAMIGVNGKQIFLGYHKEVKDAAIAYDSAAKKYHGEFAYLNFK